MAPVAENGLDPQIRADLANGFERVGVQRVDHRHGEYLAQLVDRQQTVFETDLLGNEAQQLIADVIIGQADVGNLALFDQERDEFVLFDVSQINENLPDKPPLGFLPAEGFIQLFARDDPLTDEHLPEPAAVIRAGRLRRIVLGFFGIFGIFALFGRLGLLGRERPRLALGPVTFLTCHWSLFRSARRILPAVLVFAPAKHSSLPPTCCIYTRLWTAPQRRNCTTGGPMRQVISRCKVLPGNNLTC